MPGQFKYRAFLSYSHADLKWVNWLHRSLESYRVPPRLRRQGAVGHPLPRNLKPIFRDRDELPSGSSLPKIINEALAGSESLIVVCSKAAVASHWVNDEINAFQKLGRGDRIFCLIVDGEPMTRGSQECIPTAVRHPVDTNGKPLPNPAEPMAADLRGGWHERYHARMMLIAGLLGVGLDELLQRDHSRRTKKLFALTSSAVLLAIAMAGLTAFALLARSKAERRQTDAETLVAFMLGDLREDLHAIQRLDLYNKVSKQAMDYFRSLGEDDAGDETVALRAEALRQLGSSLLDQADTSGALDAFSEALPLAAQLVAKNPSREDWNLALAESHFYLGLVHWQRGEFEAAGAKFLEQLSIVDALTSADPGDADRLAGSGFAWTNYGRVLELTGQYEKANQAYETVMDVFQRLLILEPEDANSRLEVGFAHNNLGKLKISQGMLNEAERHFRSDLELKQQVADENPRHNLWSQHLAGSQYWLAKVLSMRGAYTESAIHAESSLAILNELIDFDPSMTPYRQRRESVYRLLAINCRVSADPGCAQTNIEAALNDLDQLLVVDPDNAKWQRDWYASTLESALQTVLSGNLEHATGLVGEVLAWTDSSDLNSNDDWETLKLRTLALLIRGDIARLSAEFEFAKFSWEPAMKILENRIEGAIDPEVIDLQAELLERLGRAGEALRVKHQLELMGYHSIYPKIGKTQD